jgi:SAM-dependent methyltransferase
MSIKSRIPWWSKIILKIILSRLPITYSFWRRVGLFRHGSMDQIEYAYNVFLKHLNNSKGNDSLVVLELGPGDSLLTALFSFAHGARASYMVDVSDFTNKDLEVYYEAMDFLGKKGIHLEFAKNDINSIDEMLDRCCSHYLTDGIESLKKIPNNSIDLVFSQAVLEHIPKSEFHETLIEINRILKREGICTHVIDLKDHLDSGLNNLRFSERLWESKFMSTSGFYTNRLRKSEMIKLFEISGFKVSVLNDTKWKEIPIKRSQLSTMFKKFSNEELSVSDFSVILKPKLVP